jgi:plastocyanin
MDSLKGSLYLGRWLKLGLVAIIILATFMGMSSLGLAQDSAKQAQTFIVHAGGSGSANTEILAFAPTDLKVHRGDTVTWITTFHNIHFEKQPTDLIVAPEMNGKPLPQANPAVFFPTIKSGATYSGGDANSGIPFPLPGSEPPSPAFSLVIDLEPGTYAYFCDIHLGMLGTITVVPDDEAIPSPSEVEQAASLELIGAANQGQQAFGAAMQASMTMPTDTTEHHVTMGASAGRASVDMFFPSLIVIKAGESVTWDIPASVIEPHTASWPPAAPGSDITPIPVEGKPPILALGPTFMPLAESGVAVKAGEPFSSGFVMPGQSYTVRFTEPGVYPYVCNLHMGMQGAVVVMPAA